MARNALQRRILGWLTAVSAKSRIRDGCMWRIHASGMPRCTSLKHRVRVLLSTPLRPPCCEESYWHNAIPLSCIHGECFLFSTTLECIWFRLPNMRKHHFRRPHANQTSIILITVRMRYILDINLLTCRMQAKTGTSSGKTKDHITMY